MNDYEESERLVEPLRDFVSDLLIEAVRDSIFHSLRVARTEGKIEQLEKEAKRWGIGDQRERISIDAEPELAGFEDEIGAQMGIER